MSKHGRILVAMSGGVDSSVASILLHEEGYEVIGITMKTWDYVSSGINKRETGCCSLDSINDARIVAAQKNFMHIVLDIRDEFNSFIVNNFVNEYLSGRTPNPCVLCNTYIKWEALLKRADALDCEFIATGHYAQIRKENNRFVISKGIDEYKDQSYVLWGLSQENLARTKFPVGKYKKSEIKQIAKNFGFDFLANKSESYDICFIPDNNYRNFLNNKVNGLKNKLKGGKIVDKNGNVLGYHEGYPFYTIGQRKGLNVAVGVPLYVTKIIPESNTIVLGEKEDLYEQRMIVKDINIIKYPHFEDGMEFLTKIRYKDKGQLSTIKVLNNNRLQVTFYKKVPAITPGQSAVFYEGNDLVGGGIIEKVN